MAYRDFFGSKYRSKYRGAEVIHDIKNLESMKGQTDADMLIRFQEAPAHYQQAQASWSLKIYQINSEIILSDILPILENIGLSVVRENSVQLADINDDRRVYNIIDLHLNPLNTRVELTDARKPSDCLYQVRAWKVCAERCCEPSFDDCRYFIREPYCHQGSDLLRKTDKLHAQY